jgi:hypothetical protein
MTSSRDGARVVALAMLVASAGCNRLVANLSGGVGPESGVLRGKKPSELHGVTHVLRLTDGIAAAPGDPWRTDLTAELAATDSEVTWDLGAEQPIRCALVDADGNDRYTLSLSSDGRTFAPVWTAEPDEDQGQQLRAGRGLHGTGRYLRLSASGGDGRWAVSEVSAWSDCPKQWPPLALQEGTPDDEAVRAKLWLLAALAIAWLLFVGPRAPEWVKLLVVTPAGIAVALGLQLAENWPPSSEVVVRLGVVVALIVAAAFLRRQLWRDAKASAPKPRAPAIDNDG